MSETDKNVVSNSVLIWCVAIIIPVASFGLYVYEVFFKEDSAVNHEARDALAIYEEARLLEVKGEIIQAYAYYKTIIEVHSNSPAAPSAQDRVNNIKKSIANEIDLLAQEKKWNELKKKENLIEVILPERMNWLNEITEQEKKNNRRDNQEEYDDQQSLLDGFQQKIELLIKNENFEQAFAESDSTLQGKNKSFRKKAEKILAQIHYAYAVNKYESIRNSMSGVDISILKQDFDKEIQEIKKHLKVFLKTADKKDINVENAKNLLQELK